MKSVDVIDLKPGDEVEITIRTTVGDGMSGQCICAGLEDGLNMSYVVYAARAGKSKIKVKKIVRAKIEKFKVEL